ncbi:MAG: biotin/lipoyl-containing protein [Alphaproteobacteria bacterium]
MKQTLVIDGEEVTLDNVARKGQEISFTLKGKSYRFLAERGADGLTLAQEIKPGVWKRHAVSAAAGKGFRRVQLGGLEARIREPGSESGSGAGPAPLSPRAPMPGLVRKIFVKKGDRVGAGTTLAVMEAMKLQTTLTAGGDGIVEAVLAREGEMVAEGAELVRIAPKKK